jgi:hypothetical protein
VNSPEVNRVPRQANAFPRPGVVLLRMPATPFDGRQDP